MRMPNGSRKPWFSTDAGGIVRLDSPIATRGIPMTSIRFSAAVLALALSSLAQAQTPTTPKLSASECEVWARELAFAGSVATHDTAAFAGIIVGGSPYNRTDEELTAFLDRLDRFLAYATRELGAKPATFREFHASFTATGVPAAVAAE